MDNYLFIDKDRLYYKVSGEGPPIVLIHGFSLDSRMWEDQVSMLTKTNTVVQYDMREFGLSTTENNIGPLTHSEEFVCLLDHLEIDSAHLIGLSFGGIVAIQFVLDKPNRVKSLVLMSSGLSGGPITIPAILFALKMIHFINCLAYRLVS